MRWLRQSAPPPPRPQVVDIYGGCMDRDNVQPVTPATLSQIYSATKGAGALMVSARALLADGSICEGDTV